MKLVLPLSLVFFLVLSVGNVGAEALFPSLQYFIDRNSQGNDQNNQNNQDPPQQAPLTTCDNNNICNIGENNANCPNDCPVEQREPEVQLPPDTNVNNQDEVLDEEEAFVSRGLLITLSGVLIFVVLVVILWFWLHKSKGKITFGKKKEPKKRNQFGLPQRPVRRFGI